MKIKFYLFLLIVISVGTLYSNDSTTSGDEKYYHIIKTGVMGLNDVYETPYYILVGKKTTPVMLVHGGMHGDEIASFMACDEIIKNINLLEGTLLIIPRLNKQADDLVTRFINIDLNHAFPGDMNGELYEYRLAYEMMWLVDSLKPDLIINLHEALTKYDTEAPNNSSKAYGQIVISCIQPFQDMLVNSVNHMNEKIPSNDQKFHPHYYAFQEWSSLDNFVAKFNITSYTVETYRGFDINTRVKLQQIAVLQFMDELGLKYEYPKIELN